MMAIADAIDGDPDLEESDPVGPRGSLGFPGDFGHENDDAEPSLAAPEAVPCSEGPATPVRRRRINPENFRVSKSDNLSDLRVDPSCDQSNWPRDDGFGSNDDREIDTADDEPSLGAPEQEPVEIVCINGRWAERDTTQENWAAGVTDEREGDLADTADDREGDEVDKGEPSLGWTGVGRGHPHADNGLGCSDLERDNSDREPSLGSTGLHDQTRWALEDSNDREHEHDGCEKEEDGHGYDDREPLLCDIPGGTHRDNFRQSVDEIGDSDLGSGRALIVGRVVDGGGVQAIAPLCAMEGADV